MNLINNIKVVDILSYLIHKYAFILTDTSTMHIKARLELSNYLIQCLTYQFNMQCRLIHLLSEHKMLCKRSTFS